jgi:hypothetical protein
VTFDDDFCRIHFDTKSKDILCKKSGLEWPPPKVIDLGGFLFKRENYSKITDQQRQEMTHVMRGAEYFPKENENG